MTISNATVGNLLCMCGFHNIRLDIVAFIVRQLVKDERSKAELTGIVPNCHE